MVKMNQSPGLLLHLGTCCSVECPLCTMPNDWMSAAGSRSNLQFGCRHGSTTCSARGPDAVLSAPTPAPAHFCYPGNVSRTLNPALISQAPAKLPFPEPSHPGPIGATAPKPDSSSFWLLGADDRLLLFGEVCYLRHLASQGWRDEADRRICNPCCAGGHRCARTRPRALLSVMGGLRSSSMCVRGMSAHRPRFHVRDGVG